MTRLVWGTPGERYFEAGVDRGVLYVEGKEGVAWTGLISVDESPSGGESQPYYIDGVKYANRAAGEEFEASLEAYTYPEEFAACDGSAQFYQAQGLYATQQQRKPFSLTYRTLVGNDTDKTDHAYKIHIIYNARANPTQKTYQSVGDDAEPTTFSWDISTSPILMPGLSRSAHIVIDTRTAWPWVVSALESILYGEEDSSPRIPDPQEILDLFVENALLKVNVDETTGIVTIEGPDEAIQMVNATEYRISWPSVLFLDSETVELSSL